MNNIYIRGGIFSTTLATVALPPVFGQYKATVQPNVIVILADDMGYGDVSAYGSKTISTPNIDYLAKQGVCFTSSKIITTVYQRIIHNLVQI